MNRDEETQRAKALLAGEAGAFEWFVDSYRNKIFRYSFLMCGHREDAEEVSQDTLLKVFENLRSLREPDRLKPWVFTIARNACLMRRRKGMFAPAQELSLEQFLPAADGASGERRLEIADWKALPDSEALRSELRRKLEEAISELPDIYRAVVLLRDVEELSTAEAAAVLGVSDEVVKTRLHRGRLALREKLEGYVSAAAGKN